MKLPEQTFENTSEVPGGMTLALSRQKKMSTKTALIRLECRG